MGCVVGCSIQRSPGPVVCLYPHFLRQIVWHQGRHPRGTMAILHVVIWEKSLLVTAFSRIHTVEGQLAAQLFSPRGLATEARPWPVSFSSTQTYLGGYDGRGPLKTVRKIRLQFPFSLAKGDGEHVLLVAFAASSLLHSRPILICQTPALAVSISSIFTRRT